MFKNLRAADSNASTSRLLDNLGRKIVVELQRDARVPFAELGRRVGLSTPAVAERVHRLERAGIITRYSAEVDPEKLGYPIRAFIGISVVGNFLQRVARISRERPEILECYRVAGAHSFFMKVAVSSIEELEQLIDSLTPYVATTTSIVLSPIVTNRIIELAQQESAES